MNEVRAREKEFACWLRERFGGELDTLDGGWHSAEFIANKAAEVFAHEKAEQVGRDEQSFGSIKCAGCGEQVPLPLQSLRTFMIRAGMVSPEWVTEAANDIAENWLKISTAGSASAMISHILSKHVEKARTTHPEAQAVAWRNPETDKPPQLDRVILLLSNCHDTYVVSGSRCTAADPKVDGRYFADADVPGGYFVLGWMPWPDAKTPQIQDDTLLIDVMSSHQYCDAVNGKQDPLHPANDEAVRLREIEHRAWHIFDDAEEQEFGWVIHKSVSGEDLDKLLALLPEDHPPVANQQKGNG